MLSWAVTFFIISIIAAVFGFSGIAATTAGIAQILFFLFLGLFVISLLMHVSRKGDSIVNKNLY
jgi:uncharacterized membrane protein YtjA (UPF0391 family)